MEPKIVSRLEREIEAVLAELFAGTETQEFPLQPSPQTLHLMAKAATTVYETAIENRQREKDQRSN
ncbi:hypothetical protein [Rosistilla oblonga]